MENLLLIAMAEIGVKKFQVQKQIREFISMSKVVAFRRALLKQLKTFMWNRQRIEPV